MAHGNTRENSWLKNLERLNLSANQLQEDPLQIQHQQGRRVRHIYGSSKVPICTVFDYGEALQNLLTPSDSDANEAVNSQTRRKHVMPLTQAIHSQSTGRWDRNSIHQARDFCPNQCHTLHTLSNTAGKDKTTEFHTQHAGFATPASSDFTRGRPSWPPEMTANRHSVLPRPRTSWVNLERRTGPSRSPSTTGPRTRTAHHFSKTGRLYPLPSPAVSRGISRGSWRRNGNLTQRCPNSNEDFEFEAMVMRILCLVLAVDNPDDVRHWLVTAPETDKAVVFDFVQVALIQNSSDKDSQTRTSSFTSGSYYATGCQTTADGQPMKRITATQEAAMATNNIVPAAYGYGVGNGDLVDRLVLDHSEPKIRTTMITNNG